LLIYRSSDATLQNICVFCIRGSEEKPVLALVYTGTIQSDLNVYADARDDILAFVSAPHNQDLQSTLSIVSLGAMPEENATIRHFYLPDSQPVQRPWGIRVLPSGLMAVFVTFMCDDTNDDMDEDRTHAEHLVLFRISDVDLSQDSFPTTYWPAFVECKIDTDTDFEPGECTLNFGPIFHFSPSRFYFYEFCHSDAHFIEIEINDPRQCACDIIQDTGGGSERMPTAVGGLRYATLHREDWTGQPPHPLHGGALIGASTHTIIDPLSGHHWTRGYLEIGEGDSASDSSSDSDLGLQDGLQVVVIYFSPAPTSACQCLAACRRLGDDGECEEAKTIVSRVWEFSVENLEEARLIIDYDEWSGWVSIQARESQVSTVNGQEQDGGETTTSAIMWWRICPSRIRHVDWL
jgi:hypothetical protein